MTVRLADPFDYKFDQNIDGDPGNDYIAYKFTGWYDEWWAELYNQQWVDDNGFVPTIQWIADYVGWDGKGDINVYADMALRDIKVTYVANGFEEENAITLERYIPWNVSPYYGGLKWSGHRLLGQYDDFGDEIDPSMTCGEILTDMLFDPASDSLTIYFDWLELAYTINYYAGDNYTYVEVNFSEGITLPTAGADFAIPDGYDFAGWFTGPDGAGQQVFDGDFYSSFETNDLVYSRNLYAHFIQTASKPQDAVSAALQLASMQATASTLADSVQMDAVNGLAADDITSSAPLYLAAACAASTYEMIAGSAAGHTVCPAQTMQAVLPSVTRRVA